jgi:hypothetical protein
MTLADLRKLSVRKQFLVHFRLRNGLECIVTEHGIAQVPELRTPPDFNLEEELAHAGDFLLEPAPVSGKPVAPGKPRRVSREELAALISASPAAKTAEHEEE